jgi:hypothetical protein
MGDSRLQACVEACNTCAEACDRCAVACLFEPNRNDLSRCIHLDMDCAEVCRLTAASVARGSELLDHVSAFCNDVCEACAAEAGSHSMDHCRRCARACLDCAAACRRVTAMTAARSEARPGLH